MKQKLIRVYTQHMRVVQIKPFRGLFCAKEETPLKVVHMSDEAGIPLTHHLIGPRSVAGTTVPPNMGTHNKRHSAEQLSRKWSE